MPDTFGAMVFWGVVLVVGLLLAVRDLRRQTSSTDVWSHEVNRPVRRPDRSRRLPRIRLREQKRPPAPGWDHHHDDYS